jgi:hypothetical protein
MGHETLAYLDLGPHDVTARLPPKTPFKVGERVQLELDFGHATWFDSVTGDRLS